MPRRDVDLGDVRVGDAFEVLERAPAGCCRGRRPARRSPARRSGTIDVVPVRAARARRRPRGTRSPGARRGQAGVARVVARVLGGVDVQRRRRHVVAAAPELHLVERRAGRRSASCRGPGGRRSGARSAARTLDREPELAEAREGQVGGLDGPSSTEVCALSKREALGPQGLARRQRPRSRPWSTAGRRANR